MKRVSASKGWLARLTGYCLRHRRNLMLAFGGSVTGMVVTALVPLVQRLVIDDVIVHHRRSLLPWAILLVVAAVVVFAMTFVRRYFGGRLALDVQYDLRTDIFSAVSRLDGARQDELDTGQLVGRATSDLQMVQGLLSVMPFLIGNLLLFVVAMVAMVAMSPLLTLVACAITPLLWLVALRSRRTLFPATWASQQEAAAVAQDVDAAVTGVRVVKGFGQEAREIARIEATSRRLFANRVRAIRLTARYAPALQAIPLLGQVGVLALGGWLATRGHLSLGTFLAFSTYLAQLMTPVRMLAMLLTVGQQARASVVRILEVVDARPQVGERPGAREVPQGCVDVEFDDVAFGYLPSEPVLHGLTLAARPGETLALVGASGSGKSTVTQLLPRFYDVSGGAVRIGGVDVRELTLDSLRSKIGVVAEESFLFSESVAVNIAYGRPEATRAQVEAAARAAEADEFIRELPDGYDTVVGEQGLTLSGGQRQRVALARALLTDPAVLLLDDATSAVDAQVEAEIHATLRRVMSGRTTLVVAHRRSSLQLADRIAVLDGGRAIACGTHDELMATSPHYRMLLSGPGDDAEGINSDGAGAPTSLIERHEVVDGVTPALWRRDAAKSEDGPQAAGTGADRSGLLTSLPATAELLAQVEKLPPARDEPRVDPDTARQGDERFGLRGMLRPFRLPLGLGLVLVALDALASLALPMLIRHGIDDGVRHRMLTAVFVAALIGLAVVLADWLVEIGDTRVTGRTGERVLYTLRIKIFAHLQRLGLDYYERELAGRIMTRMTTDVDALSTFLQTGLVTAVVSVFTFFGILIALLVVNAGLALVVFAVLPALGIATAIFRVKSSRAYAEAREKVGAVNADLQENVAGLRVTQAFRREEHNRERFAARSDDYRRTRVRAQRYIATYFPFVQFLSDVAALLVLIFGARWVHAGTLSIGSLIAYLLYIDLFFSPVQQLSQVFDGYQQAAVGLNRIRELLRIPTGTPPPSRPRPVSELTGEIVFDDVHFRYEGASVEAIKGVDLTIAPGETVALVGETGAGKSTVVKLIARFYDVTAGSVRVDGTDVREFDMADYRHRLGIVPQEPYLFPGTIRDNIAYGRPEASDADVERAARGVGAHDMIARLRGGYLHPVGERGRALSAGQRQLVALARAYLVNPDILLLDEATASLDLASEAAVTAATERLARRPTTVVVAHRLTTAMRADRVIVLDQGQVVESGGHAELLATGGAYAQMWRVFSGEATAA